MMPESLRAPQLKERAIPRDYQIITSIGPVNSYDQESKDALRALHASVVNFETKVSDLVRGKQTSHVFSEIDSTNKRSDSFIDCLALILVGRGKKTSENISFLSHQSPMQVLGDARVEYMTDLDAALREFADRVELHTIDALIIGGKANDEIVDEESDPDVTFSENYRNAIRLISGRVHSILGLDAFIPAGPLHEGFMHIWFDTQNRRLFVQRPAEMSSQAKANFHASETDVVSEKWKE